MTHWYAYANECMYVIIFFTEKCSVGLHIDTLYILWYTCICPYFSRAWLRYAASDRHNEMPTTSVLSIVLRLKNALRISIIIRRSACSTIDDCFIMKFASSAIECNNMESRRHRWSALSSSVVRSGTSGRHWGSSIVSSFVTRSYELFLVLGEKLAAS